MMFAGAYSRETGLLQDSRPAKNPDGSNAYSTGPMEWEWLLLIAEDLPPSVAVGVGSVEEEHDFEGEDVKITRHFLTVNGVEYRCYMPVPPALPVEEPGVEVEV